MYLLWGLYLLKGLYSGVLSNVCIYYGVYICLGELLCGLCSLVIFVVSIFGACILRFGLCLLLILE